MKLYGLQKMTLLDYPGKVACTVFTGGCNFRCPFCHNALLVTDLAETEPYDEEEILAFLDKRKGLLDGVCVTGGEPLMNRDIGAFLREIRQRGFAVKLDTNGSYPDVLKRIVAEGLVDYVAMDIKNCREKYAETAGVAASDAAGVGESVSFLLSGAVPYEFRTTVVKEFHTVEDIEAIAAWIKGAPRYYLQNFTDSGNLIGQNMSAVPKQTLYAMRDAAKRILPCVELRGV